MQGIIVYSIMNFIHCVNWVLSSKALFDKIFVSSFFTPIIYFKHSLFCHYVSLFLMPFDRFVVPFRTNLYANSPLWYTPVWYTPFCDVLIFPSSTFNNVSLVHSFNQNI